MTAKTPPTAFLVWVLPASSFHGHKAWGVSVEPMIQSSTNEQKYLKTIELDGFQDRLQEEISRILAVTAILQEQ